jgi:urease subunit alpha
VTISCELFIDVLHFRVKELNFSVTRPCFTLSRSAQPDPHSVYPTHSAVTIFLPNSPAHDLLLTHYSLSSLRHLLLSPSPHYSSSPGKAVYAVRNIRTIGKKDMILNNSLPVLSVDPETYRVEADGIHLTCEPATVLPLAQRYFLF